MIGLEVKKSGSVYYIDHNFAKIRIDSYNFLSVEKTLTLNNVIILIKLVFNKTQNQYYCNISPVAIEVE